MHFLSVFIRDFLRRSWTFRRAAPYKSYAVLYCETVIPYAVVIDSQFLHNITRNGILTLSMLK